MYTNAQPRFALDDQGRLMDYAKGTTVEATGTLTDDAGTWDLAQVKALIQQGKSVESALTTASSASSNAKATQASSVLSKIKQAWHDFEAHFESESKEHDKVAQAGKDFHATIEQHLAEFQGTASAPASTQASTAPDTSASSTASPVKQSALSGEATPTAFDFPKEGAAVSDAKIPLQPTGQAVGTGLAAATPGATSTAVQENAEFKASAKDTANVDAHDIQKVQAASVSQAGAVDAKKEG